MAGNIQQNWIPSEPQLADAFQILKKEILLGFNCHHIGTVQSFNSDNQTISFTINYKKTFFQFNQQTTAYESVLQDYPITSQCPVIVLGGGNGALTFPIEQGDECLILFNDRDLDNWFSGSSSSPTSTARLHSFSDAIAIVGLRSLPNVLENYDPARAVLRGSLDGTAMVGVGDALIKIANNTTTLNTLLQSLLTSLNTLITQTAAITVTGVTPGAGTSGVPVNAAAIVAVGVQLSTLATEISGLLE